MKMSKWALKSLEVYGFSRVWNEYGASIVFFICQKISKYIAETTKRNHKIISIVKKLMQKIWQECSIKDVGKDCKWANKQRKIATKAHYQCEIKGK